MRKILAVLLAAFCLVLVAGCSDTSAKDVDLKEILGKFNSDFDLSDNMKEITDVNDLNKYYSIDTNDVVSFAAEIDTSGLDEIVLVQAKDAEAAARVEEKLQARYDSRSKQIASYSPENYEIMKKCEGKTDGNYVRMILAESAQEMAEVYNSYF